ncbi:hypothetical protein [Streptomyces galilaeus]|nr:hypothetical protein [Streptomyces galilaeus]GGW79743.1 hypothetical protein GCM10010350_75750 [Streptomyces galilaeus]
MAGGVSSVMHVRCPDMRAAAAFAAVITLAAAVAGALAALFT